MGCLFCRYCFWRVSIILKKIDCLVAILVIGLGLFSAIYTYFGGLSAVVKTDIIQFFILLTGGAIVMFVAIHQLGGWSQLYVKTGDLMHLHLPADHETLPWPHIFGLFLLKRSLVF